MILHFLSDLNTICQIYKKYFKIIKTIMLAKDMFMFFLNEY